MRRARRHGTTVDLGIKPGRRARRKARAGGAAVATLMLVAAGCGSNSTGAAGNTPVNGGTVTYALPANVTPNYIFPFSPGGYFTIVNTSNLQYLMYRPLYWWGDKGKPYLNEPLSLAYLPTYKGQLVTIKLKPNWKWSNGLPITAQDVMFWMNMMKTEASTEWGGYIPGGIPDNVTNVHAVGTDEVQMTVKGKFSTTWFTDNELSQISPMPEAWDVTGPNTKSDCSDKPSDCPAVFKYLDKLSKNTATWTTSSLWKIVDGPWQLTKYTTDGTLTYSYNPLYSGPVPKNHVSKFVEVPFTSEQAEYGVLQASGAEGQNKLDIGYLPTVNAPVPPPGSAVGQNPVAGYKMQPVFTWGLNYIPYNFSKSNPQLAVTSQLYIRQALQFLINQSAIVQGALHGYGVVTTGPVGPAPQTKYLSPTMKKGDPFPFSVQRAHTLLSQHGWTVHPAGTTVCTSPGTGTTQCGEGIKAGTKLDLTMLYASGNAWVEAAMLELKSNAASVGIQIGLTPKTFDGVLTVVENLCGAPSCPWELANWGEGWSYVPDYLPTGDELFGTGSAGNLGHYSNAHNDELVKKSVQSSNLNLMYQWEDYLTDQLPVMYQPAAPAALVETVDNLRIGPLDPTLAISPESWYFVK
jgi:peptide/nickel transport system substrate-binding protein